MQILVFIFMFITYADIFNTVFYNKAPSLCVRIFCFYFFLSKMKIYKSIFTVSMWTRKMYVFYSVSMRLMLFPGTVGGSSECFEIVFTCSCGLISFWKWKGKNVLSKKRPVYVYMWRPSSTLTFFSASAHLYPESHWGCASNMFPLIPVENTSSEYLNHACAAMHAKFPHCALQHMQAK